MLCVYLTRPVKNRLVQDVHLIHSKKNMSISVFFLDATLGSPLELEQLHNVEFQGELDKVVHLSYSGSALIIKAVALMTTQ